MTDKDLKKMSRTELLELLLEQTKEVERLREKLLTAESLLSDRHLRVEFTGNLAEAVLSVNGVMDAAQKAADQYLFNIKQMEESTRQHCEQLIRSATEEAARIRHNAGIR